MSSGSGSHFQFARQLKVIAKFSNPLMFNMILDGIWETCDLEEIAGIYLYSSGEDSYAFDRLTEVIAERGIGEDIRRILDEKHGVRIQFGESPKRSGHRPGQRTVPNGPGESTNRDGRGLPVRPRPSRFVPLRQGGTPASPCPSLAGGSGNPVPPVRCCSAAS